MKCHCVKTDIYAGDCYLTVQHILQSCKINVIHVIHSVCNYSHPIIHKYTNFDDFTLIRRNRK